MLTGFAARTPDGGTSKDSLPRDERAARSRQRRARCERKRGGASKRRWVERAARLKLKRAIRGATLLTVGGQHACPAGNRDKQHAVLTFPLAGKGVWGVGLRVFRCVLVLTLGNGIKTMWPMRRKDVNCDPWESSRLPSACSPCNDPYYTLGRMLRKRRHVRLAWRCARRSVA